MAVLEGGQSQETEPTSGEPKDDEPAPAKESPSFDPKQLAQELGTVITQSFQQNQSQAVKPPITPEEAKKLLKVWEPDDDFLAEFGDLEKQKNAFGKLRDGLIRQADTLMQMRLAEMQDLLASQIQPALTFVEEQRYATRKSAFDKKYPELTDPNLQPVLDAVATKLANQKFESDEAMFEALAKGAEATIKQINPSFALGGSQQTQTKPRSSGIAVTSPGGGGAGGGSNPPVSGKSTALSILGNV